MKILLRLSRLHPVFDYAELIATAWACVLGLAFLLALLWPASAAAADTPEPPDTSVPSCWPSRYKYLPIGGTGTPVETVTTSAGTGYTYRCPDGSTPWKVVRSTWSGPNSSDLLAEAMTYPSIADAASALWHKYDTPKYLCPPSTVCDQAWIDLADATKAKAAAVAPLPPEWVVAKNGSYTTRPAYTSASGMLGAASGRATVIPTTACNCASPIKVGTSTYCTFTGAPSASIVALCSKAAAP